MQVGAARAFRRAVKEGFPQIRIGHTSTSSPVMRYRTLRGFRQQVRRTSQWGRQLPITERNL
jgi:hypothetical protein